MTRDNTGRIANQSVRTLSNGRVVVSRRGSARDYSWRPVLLGLIEENGGELPSVGRLARDMDVTYGCAKQRLLRAQREGLIDGECAFCPNGCGPLTVKQNGLRCRRCKFFESC